MLRRKAVLVVLDPTHFCDIIIYDAQRQFSITIVIYCTYFCRVSEEGGDKQGVSDRVVENILFNKGTSITQRPAAST